MQFNMVREKEKLIFEQIDGFCRWDFYFKKLKIYEGWLINLLLDLFLSFGYSLFKYIYILN